MSFFPATILISAFHQQHTFSDPGAAFPSTHSLADQSAVTSSKVGGLGRISLRLLADHIRDPVHTMANSLPTTSYPASVVQATCTRHGCSTCRTQTLTRADVEALGSDLDILDSDKAARVIERLSKDVLEVTGQLC